MGDSGTQKTPAGSGSNKKAKATSNTKKELKILMLHGYTQSGPLFRSKTRALEKLLAKSLAPLNLAPTLIYPTGPLRLRPQDIPGYQPPADDQGSDDTETDAWSWFRKDEATDSYRQLDQGMQRIAETMAASVSGDPDGPAPIAGVIGFSQGGSMAALLAAAMEADPAPRTAPAGEEGWEWVAAVRAANGGRPLRFAVIYSGFYATPADLRWLYEPPVATPTLQFIGSLDTVVDEGRSRGLVERCRDPVVVVHPGGHHVPVAREWVMPLVGFIKKIIVDDAPEE